MEPLPSPAGDGTVQAQLTAANNSVIVSWLENASSQTALKYSERTASGWSEARLVAFGDNFFTNYADVPSVTRLADRTLVAHWMEMNGGGRARLNLRLSRSTDEGRTWSGRFPHTRSHAHTTRLRHAVRPGNGLGRVWLDGRAMKPGVTADDEGPTGAAGHAFRFTQWPAVCGRCRRSRPFMTRLAPNGRGRQHRRAESSPTVNVRPRWYATSTPRASPAYVTVAAQHPNNWNIADAGQWSGDHASGRNAPTRWVHRRERGTVTRV